MPLRLQAFSRYRPRALTLVLFSAVAAMLLLANASYATWAWGHYGGWPLMWYREVTGPGPNVVSGWQLNAARFAGDAVMWVMMLSAPAAVCESVLRRYRPRLRWSLRTMLIAVGLVAAFFGWFVVARNRADLQDPVISALPGGVLVERWGSRWLDVVGVDRFRRTIVGAAVAVDDEEAEQVLQRLARLPKLQYLFLTANDLTPRMVTALSEMRQLRMLSIDQMAGLRGADDDIQVSYQCLEAIGQMTQLEHLHLKNMKIAGDGLPSLAGLTNLQSLSLEWISADRTPLLRHLPALPRVEVVDIYQSEVGDDDVHHLVALPRLKSLGLESNDVTDAQLAELASAESLEELAICGEMITARGLLSLLAITRLSTLHVCPYHDQSDQSAAVADLPFEQGVGATVRRSELDDCRRAWKTLRQSKPRIKIDSEMFTHNWEVPISRVPPEYDSADRTASACLPWLQASFWRTDAQPDEIKRWEW